MVCSPIATPPGLIKLAEIGHSRPLTFSDFVEGFSSGVTAMLAYIWQQLWLTIWSLIGLPGFLLMTLQLLQVSGNRHRALCERRHRRVQLCGAHW